MKRIIVIGAGASGQTAAIEAKRQDPAAQVIILEKNPLPGKKIRATGNGRCNMTNTGCPGYRDVLKFFESIGVLTATEEEGRIYPYSRSAKDVELALERALGSLGVEVMPKAPVLGITKAGETSDYEITAMIKGKTEVVHADRILIATGGKAGPQFGTTGDGYKLAKELGHTVTRLAPCLTGVRVEEDTKDLAGMRAGCEATLLEEGREVFREKGEVQFTDYGLSGICIFNMTRYMTVPEGMDLEEGMDRFRIRLDLLPETDDPGPIMEERDRLSWLSGPDILVSLAREPIRKHIFRIAEGDPGKMAEILKSWTFVPRMPMGWKHAQVTKGGVPYSQVNRETMESLISPGLYFAGEILDYDGPCGGYNLQHAFETGLIAGKAIGK